LIKYTFEALVKEKHPDAWYSGQQWSMWTILVPEGINNKQIGRGYNLCDAWRDTAYRLGLTNRQAMVSPNQVKQFYTEEYKKYLAE